MEPDAYQRRLMAAFGFGPAELIANRAGRPSARQSFAGYRRSVLAIVMAAALVVLAPAALAVVVHRRLPLLLVAVGVAAAGWVAWRAAEPRRRGEVQAVEGGCRVEVADGRRVLAVGDLRLEIPPAAAEVIVPGPHRVYLRGARLLSIEPASTPR